MKYEFLRKIINYRYFIYLYTFLLPFTYFGSQMGLLTGILIFWWILDIKNNKKFYKEKLYSITTSKPIIFMVTFLIFATLSYFWSSNKEEFFSTLNSQKYFFYLLPIIYTSLTKREALKNLKILGISFGVYGFFSLLIYLGLFSWDGSTQENPKFLFRYMITGAYLVLGTYLLYYFAVLEKNITYRIFYIILCLITFIGIFINNGRAAQVAFIITLIFFIIINSKKIKLNLKIILILATAFFIVINIILNKNMLVIRYEKAFNQIKIFDLDTNYYSSTGQRLKMYYTSLELWKNEPFLGVGGGDLKDLFHKYVIDNNIKLGWMYNTVHSIYSEYLVKYGIIGLFLFLFSFISLFIELKDTNKGLYVISILPLLIIFLFDSILLYKPFNNVFIYTFTLLCILGDKKILKKR
ncbi:O-antigen ligase [Malaciobacter marinus]|nr:O-antigen ligase [Malaciobacter marinus]